MTRDQVVEKLGQPYYQWRGHDPDEQQEERSGWSHYRYTDGKTDVHLMFQDGKLARISRSDLDTLPQSVLTFATVFQSFYLRLAIFFGCVGIFVNLFRGEMLDKSLHFYLLTPIRREVLLAGKYLAGLLATVVIFTASTALQWLAMLWQYDHAAIAGYLAGPGWGQLASYLGVTVLACVGYGSVFLAVGLLFRNPIIPAMLVLVWESVNPFLPSALKKISMIYYLQSLCPVVAAPDRDMPPMLNLLISPTQPATPVMAIAGIAILTILVLVVCGRLARRLEINYSTD
jgi:ABC-type transport system involved in multi-copper enzyme maturation permease subunit